MSGKQDKKQRQFFRKKFAEEYKDKAAEIAKNDMNMFRPKPGWIPMRVWVWILGFFIKIKK